MVSWFSVSWFSKYSNPFIATHRKTSGLGAPLYLVTGPKTDLGTRSDILLESRCSNVDDRPSRVDAIAEDGSMRKQLASSVSDRSSQPIHQQRGTTQDAMSLSDRVTGIIRGAVEQQGTHRKYLNGPSLAGVSVAMRRMKEAKRTKHAAHVRRA